MNPKPDDALHVPQTVEVSNSPQDRDSERRSTHGAHLLRSLNASPRAKRQTEGDSVDPNREGPSGGEESPQKVEELRKVEIDGPGKTIQIGTTLPGEEDEALAMLLIDFKELFAWKPNDMPGISKEKIVHELNIDPNIKPIAQKRRHVGKDKAISIRQEVGKLVDANFVKDIMF